MQDTNERDTYIKSAENAIRSLIEQIKANPSNLAALISNLQALLSIEGLDRGLVEAAMQALAEASEKAKSSSMSGGFSMEAPPLTDSQKKLIAGFYVSLEDLKEELHQYSGSLEKLNKHNAEFESLTLAIDSTPFSQNAITARARQGTLILEMVDTLSNLTHHNTNCETRLEQCHARRKDIEQDNTFTAEQKNAFFSQAEKEVQEVERELQSLKAQGAEYDAKVAEHFERALLDMTAVTYCNTIGSATEQDYRHIINDGLSEETKLEVHDFIQSIKAVPAEQRHTRYDGFMSKLVSTKMGELDVAKGINASKKVETDAEIKVSSDDLFGAIIEAAPDKKQGFAESIKKQREENTEQSHGR